MSAKTYDKKTAAFAGFIIQNIPPNLTEDTMQGWMDNPSAMKRFLSGLAPREVPFVEISKTFLSVVLMTFLAAVNGMKTADCFDGIGWSYRDVYFDQLPEYQPDADACVVLACASICDRTLTKVIHALPGAPQTDDIILLGNWLIKNGHTLALTQVERLVDRTRSGEDIGLRANGSKNYFFAETNDSKNPVSVGCVCNCEGIIWDSSVYWKLDYVNLSSADLLLMRQDFVTV